MTRIPPVPESFDVLAMRTTAAEGAAICAPSATRHNPTLCEALAALAAKLGPYDAATCHAAIQAISGSDDT